MPAEELDVDVDVDDRELGGRFWKVKTTTGANQLDVPFHYTRPAACQERQDRGKKMGLEIPRRAWEEKEKEESRKLMDGYSRALRSSPRPFLGHYDDGHSSSRGAGRRERGRGQDVGRELEWEQTVTVGHWSSKRAGAGLWLTGNDALSAEK